MDFILILAAKARIAFAFAIGIHILFNIKKFSFCLT